MTLVAPAASQFQMGGTFIVGKELHIILPDGVREEDVQFQWMRMKTKLGGKDDKKVYTSLSNIEGATNRTYHLTTEDGFKFVFCKVTYNGKTEIIKMPLIVFPNLFNSPALTYNGEKQILDYQTLITLLSGDDGSLALLCEELEKSGYDIKDYILLEGNEGTDVGKYTCKVLFQDCPENNFEVPWNIEPADISKAKVTIERLIYNGEEQTCIPKVTMEGFDSIDYDISGNKATKIGKYEMVLTGKGNFTGKIRVNWAISDGMPDSPDTGDPNQLYLWVVLLLCSLGVIASSLYRRKNKK